LLKTTRETTLANIQNTQPVPINTFRQPRLSKGPIPGDIVTSNRFAECCNSPVCASHQLDGHKRFTTMDLSVYRRMRMPPNWKDKGMVGGALSHVEQALYQQAIEPGGHRDTELRMWLMLRTWVLKGLKG
jgi:hypothetical protein